MQDYLRSPCYRYMTVFVTMCCFLMCTMTNRQGVIYNSVIECWTACCYPFSRSLEIVEKEKGYPVLSTCKLMMNICSWFMDTEKKSLHRKLTWEKKIVPQLLPRHKPVTF